MSETDLHSNKKITALSVVGVILLFAVIVFMWHRSGNTIHFRNSTQREINEEFLDDCIRGDISDVTEFLDKYIDNKNRLSLDDLLVLTQCYDFAIQERHGKISEILISIFDKHEITITTFDETSDFSVHDPWGYGDVCYGGSELFFGTLLYRRGINGKIVAVYNYNDVKYGRWIDAKQ